LNISKKFRISVLFLFSLGAIVVTPAPSFSQGRLTVIVTDLEQVPMQAVGIEICSPALDRVRTGGTNAQGLCNFEDLPEGSYQVKLLVPQKKIPPKRITVSSKTEVLRMRIERPYVVSIHEDFKTPPPVDPAITSFTSSDAKILSEASSSLNKSIALTWDRMATAVDVCERREILMEALENWKGILGKTRRTLVNIPQAHEKRFMINRVFDGMVKHTRCDMNALREFDQNASELRVALDKIAKILKRAADSGKVTFDLQVVSFPEGAKLTYDYLQSYAAKEHPELAPTTIKDLYFAECQIHFKHEGYRPAGITYDPYSSLKDGVHQLRVNLLDRSQSGYQKIPFLEECVRESDLVILGKVQDSQCRRDEEKSDIFTYVTVAVEEGIKGSNILREDNIVIKSLGGFIREEGVIQHVERHPAGLSPPGFEKGEGVLLLLRRFPESEYYQVVAGQHGKFSIMKDDKIAGRYVPLKEFIQKIQKIIKSE
jgi:hypothetical protein